jgi:hypothetical protein
MFYVINGQFGKTLDDVRNAYPNVSVPASGVVEIDEVSAYLPKPQPTYDSIRKGVREIAPMNGEQSWEVYDLDASQLQINLNNLASSVRAQRNQKLAQTDWMMLSDAATDKAAVAAYRQALRDVPEQAGFPENIVWPAL